MCDLRRRGTRSMNSTCINKHTERMACHVAAAVSLIWTEWPLVVFVVAQCKGLYWSVATRCRVTLGKAGMLGVVFHSGPGVPSVLALSRPVGLKAPSPRWVSTSNSWRSVSTAKVGGMLGQVAPAQYLNTFLNWTSGVVLQRQPDI